jgi:membrane-bound lytic murein transglycosylase A
MMVARIVATCVLAFATLGSPVALAGALRIPEAQLEPALFANLRGWFEDDHAAAFAAFQKSCDPILKRRTAKMDVRLLERALREPCERATLLKKPVTAEAARIFFEENFRAVRISKVGEREGFITGYYEPEIDGSRTSGNGFTIPMYRKPPELVSRAPASAKLNRPSRTASSKKTATGTRVPGRIVPYHDRAAIEAGALAGRNLEICWVGDEIDAFFTHIQGSARVRMRDGKILRINYAAQNGHPYLAVGRVLIERGIVPSDEMTMDKIRTFMSEHPEEGRELMRMNRSYIFFREVEELGADAEPIGAQGVSLTRDRSIAVDRSIHVYGTPFWIDAELPLKNEGERVPFRRLMLAQDTGGAIVGPARADIYFGAGIEAGTVAGRLRHNGTFYMLVPRSLDPSRVADVPLPVKRPKP